MSQHLCMCIYHCNILRFDHIDAPTLCRAGVRIGYTPEVLNSDVADIAVCLTIAVLRDFKNNLRYVIIAVRLLVSCINCCMLSDVLNNFRCGILNTEWLKTTSGKTSMVSSLVD